MSLLPELLRLSSWNSLLALEPYIVYSIVIMSGPVGLGTLIIRDISLDCIANCTADLCSNITTDKTRIAYVNNMCTYQVLLDDDRVVKFFTRTFYCTLAAFILSLGTTYGSNERLMKDFNELSHRLAKELKSVVLKMAETDREPSSSAYLSGVRDHIVLLSEATGDPMNESEVNDQTSKDYKLALDVARLILKRVDAGQDIFMALMIKNVVGLIFNGIMISSLVQTVYPDLPFYDIHALPCEVDTLDGIESQLFSCSLRNVSICRLIIYNYLAVMVLVILYAFVVFVHILFMIFHIMKNCCCNAVEWRAARASLEVKWFYRARFGDLDYDDELSKNRQSV